MYKLGVLISVYHDESPDLFRRAIASILTQRMTVEAEIRVYLGVDGPVPEALDLAIREVEPLLYRVMRFPKNRGLAYVLNDLIRSRQDEDFYFRMDTDDVSHPERFDKQLHYMRAHPEVDVLGTDIVETDAASAKSHVVHFADNPVDARRRISRRVPVAHPTVSFRARVFDKIAGYPLTHLNEDIAMWFACLQAGFIFDNVAEPLYEFRISKQFWARRSLQKAWLEFSTYCAGLWALEGVSWKFCFPLLRLGLRLIPGPLQKLAYRSMWRTGHPIPASQSSEFFALNRALVGFQSSIKVEAEMEGASEDVKEIVKRT